MKTKLFSGAKRYNLLLSASLSVFLISCGGESTTIGSEQDGPPTQDVDVSQIPDAVPQQTRRSKYGNPDSYVVFGKRYHIMSSGKNYKERGIASWYGSKFHGRRTSSGDPYDMHGMTAAHKTLPLPTYVKVTNLRNNRQVILKVNDRGPFHENRIIDLSHTAAVKLGIKATGTGLVEVKAIDPDKYNASQKLSETTPSPAPPSSVSGTQTSSSVSLYLQLGAFANSQNASNLKNKVNSSINSHVASISTTSKNNQQFYRVRIGPISAVEKADQLAQTLTQKGFDDSRIVIE